MTREDYNGNEAFLNEIRAYSTVVPILASISPHQQLPYPRCHFSGFHNKDEVIVLEDLTQSGYSTPNRLKTLNFQQCDLVLRKFAHLHATSMVLRIVNRKDFNRALRCIDDYIFTPGKVNCLPKFFEEMAARCLRCLRRNNEDGKLCAAIAFYEQHFLDRQLFSVAQRLVRREKDENLLTICHGDSWLNNLMFRQNAEGLVDDVKLLDLQVMRYTSPTIDLLHFLYSSTDTQCRDQYFDKLMGSYQEALMQSIDEMAEPYLDSLEVRERIEHLKSLHTEDLVKERMHRNSLYGLAQFILTLPVFTCTPTVLLNPDVNSEPEEFSRRLRETVLEFYERGALKEEFLS